MAKKNNTRLSDLPEYAEWKKRVNAKFDAYLGSTPIKVTAADEARIAKLGE